MSDSKQFFSWSLHETAVLEYFVIGGENFLACPGAIYILNKSEENLLDIMDQDDLFGASSEGSASSKLSIKSKPAKLVYKFKKPALAFCIHQQTNETILFSLHSKRQSNITQSQSSASFYVECTSINGIENFVCKKPNVILFDVQNSDILEGETFNEFKAEEKTGENWILAVDSDKVKPEFFDLADIPKTTRPSVILLIHLVEDGNRLRVVLLKSGSLQTLSDIRCLADLKASRKINILLNEKVFEEIVPERTETLETTKDTIEFILSQQKGRVDHLNDVHSLSKIINVAAFKDVTSDNVLKSWSQQLVSGVLIEICKHGRDVVKTLIPITRAAKIFVHNNVLSVFASSGMLYRLKLPFITGDKIVKTGKCDAGIEEFLHVTEVLQVFSKDLEEKEEILSQLRMFLSVDDSMPFSVNIVVDAEDEKYTLKVQLKADKKLDFALIGKYWHLLTMICPHNVELMTTSCDALPMPGRFDESLKEWTTLHLFPETFLSPNNFPLVIKVSLVLSVGQKSLWSKTLSEERLYLIDFSTVKAIKNTSKQLFGSESSFEKMMITSGPTETVDDFLDKLNRTRVVFEVFDSMKSAADEIDLVFRLEIEKDFLQRQRRNQLFVKILELDSLDEKDETLISATVLGSDVSISVLDISTDDDASKLRLAFHSSDGELLRKLKTELLELKCSHVAQSVKEEIEIPVGLVQQVEDVRAFVDAIGDEGSEENFAALDSCYRYLREHISPKLP